MGPKTQPDIDLCSECQEHASFACCEEALDGLECGPECEGGFESNCCGAPAYATDFEYEIE